MAPGLALAAASLDSQLVFAWRSLTSAQVAAILDFFIAHAGWPRAEHWRALTLASCTKETPDPVHLVDSYRPRWSTTSLPCTAEPAHRGKVGGQWSQLALAADLLG